MICINCGKLIEVNRKYCGQCRYKYPWNKGLNKETDARIKESAIKESKTKHINPHTAWNKGICCPRTKESILKMVETNKIKYDGSPMKNKHHSFETIKIIKEKNTGRKCTIDQKNKISLALSNKPKPKGKQSPSWIDGRSFLPYCNKFNNQLKEAVRERDGHICQLCGINQKDLIGRAKHLSIHHIHYDKENCYPDLITLCIKCNGKVNFNRKHYEELFMNKLNDRELLFWNRYDI